MNSAVVALEMADPRRPEIRIFYPTDRSKVAPRHRKFIGKPVTVTGWQLAWQRDAPTPSGEATHGIRWFGRCKETGYMYPESELIRPPEPKKENPVDPAPKPNH